MRGLLLARFGTNQRLVAERGHAGDAALVQLLLGKARVIVLAQGGKQGVRHKVGLHPQFAVAAQCRIATCPATGLHQQSKQALGRAKVAAE